VAAKDALLRAAEAADGMARVRKKASDAGT
jgi:hypothetical protein